MVTVQYMFQNTIESLRLSYAEAMEYCEALSASNVSYQIIN